MCRNPEGKYFHNRQAVVEHMRENNFTPQEVTYIFSQQILVLAPVCCVRMVTRKNNKFLTVEMLAYESSKIVSLALKIFTVCKNIKNIFF
jgi:hypothetical protein